MPAAVITRVGASGGVSDGAASGIASIVANGSCLEGREMSRCNPATGIGGRWVSGTAGTESRAGRIEVGVVVTDRESGGGSKG